MKKTLVAMIGAVLLIGLALALAGCTGDDGDDGSTGPAGPAGPQGSAADIKPAIQEISIVIGEGKVIEEVGDENVITGEFHRWEPSTLVVHKGDTVRLTVTNPRSKVHSLIIPDLGVTTPGMEPRGGTATVEFTADKAGTFQYACGIPYDREDGALDCNLDHARQVGYLIVLDR